MPAHGPEVPHDVRIAIVTMKFFFHLPWTDIASKLGIERGTAAQTWARTISRATDANDFKSLCTAAAVLKRSGRPRKDGGVSKSRKTTPKKKTKSTNQATPTHQTVTTVSYVQQQQMTPLQPSRPDLDPSSAVIDPIFATMQMGGTMPLGGTGHMGGPLSIG